jgi:anti-sigma B factor antagonist
MRLGADTWDDRGRTVIELNGELDMFTAPLLRDVLLGVSGDGGNFLAVVMSGVAFLDSSGLGVLIGAAKRANAGGGGLCIAGARDNVLKVLRITGLTRVMPAFPTLEEAFDWLEQLRARGRPRA